MQAASNARKLSRVFKTTVSLYSFRFPTPLSQDPTTSFQCSNHSTVSGNCFPAALSNLQSTWNNPMCSMMARASFCSAATLVDTSPTEAVKEVYDKMMKSIGARTMPPNAMLWLLIEKCANNEDIGLLFDVIENLRRFRLSNLRIHTNFNENLCREVARACARVGALDYGKKILWKHNVYGLSPSIASAHHLLLYAKEHNDVELMVEVMKLLKRNNLPLQPGTADIVFRICNNADNWEMISKYSKKFLRDGVKLRKTTFDTWMEFAAKRGDTESLWEIEKLRSDSTNQHSIASGISCAKGLLLEQKPKDAAALIQVLNQVLPEDKRPTIMVELQRMVSEWPVEVVKHQKDKKALAAYLRRDVPIMVDGLLNEGLKVTVNLEDLHKEDLLS